MPRHCRLLAAAVLALAAPASAQLDKATCDQITARLGHSIPDCQKLVDGATKPTPPPAPPAKPSGGPTAADCQKQILAGGKVDPGCVALLTPPSGMTPPPGYPGPANPIPGGIPGYPAPPTGTPPAAPSSPTMPAIPVPSLNGLTPGSDDCGSYAEAFEVLGSFTNWAFYMGDAERQTLHGIYIEDASQNSQDAQAKALASVGAADGCSDLSALAGKVNSAYQTEFDQWTVALKICAMDKTAGKWLKCADSGVNALKTDDTNRAAGGPLDQYLAAVDSGHSQCLSGDDRAWFEDVRQRPCKRMGVDGPNRCGTPRYGLYARLGQVRKVRAALGKINPASALGLISKKASDMLGDSHSMLTQIADGDAPDDTWLFKGTYEAYAVQKMMQPGNRLCPNNNGFVY